MAITQQQTVSGEWITPRNIALGIVGGVVALGVGYVAVKNKSLLDEEISTENATSAIALLGGVAGGLTQLVAGQMLSGVEGNTVKVKQLIAPIGVMTAGSLAATAFVPRE